jgi:hypothetical protein
MHNDKNADCVDMINRTVYTLCVTDCPVLSCRRYRIWGSMFLKPEDLEEVREISLLRLVTNTGLGLVSLYLQHLLLHIQTGYGSYSVLIKSAARAPCLGDGAEADKSPPMSAKV